jgi:hypothetical protein
MGGRPWQRVRQPHGPAVPGVRKQGLRPALCACRGGGVSRRRGGRASLGCAGLLARRRAANAGAQLVRHRTRREGGRERRRALASLLRGQGAQVDFQEIEGSFCKNIVLWTIWAVHAPDRAAAKGGRRGHAAWPSFGAGFVVRDCHGSVIYWIA